MIEILLVTVLIGILSIQAASSYSKYVNSAKIKTAQSDLEFLALKFEHRYQRMLSYPVGVSQNTSELQLIVDDWHPASEAVDFSFSADNTSASSYTIKATGISGSVKDCVIELTHDGVKSIDGCRIYLDDGEWL